MYSGKVQFLSNSRRKLFNNLHELPILFKVIQRSNLTLRNQPIISLSVQEQITQTRVLFAGCGLGSCVAESFARMGLEKFVLIDNDTIESHNLNRQSFAAEDIGKSKVEALRRRVLEINPAIHVDAKVDLLNRDNAKNYVSKCDIIVDTIDFLDLGAILSLHDEALAQSKPVISLFTAGWGAVAMFIPPTKAGASWAREIFQVKSDDRVPPSYTRSFISFFEKIGPHLNPKVSAMMEDVFKKMLDNKPCPAPNVIAGAQSAAILAQKLFVSWLSKEPMPEAPKFVYLDLDRVLSNSLIDVENI